MRMAKVAGMHPRLTKSGPENARPPRHRATPPEHCAPPRAPGTTRRVRQHPQHALTIPWESGRRKGRTST
eukprot:6355476-Pyramimonas_sp.AAC.1